MAACDRLGKGALEQDLCEQGLGVDVDTVTEQGKAGQCEKERGYEAGHHVDTPVIASRRAALCADPMACNDDDKRIARAALGKAARAQRRSWGDASSFVGRHQRASARCRLKVSSSMLNASRIAPRIM